MFDVGEEVVVKIPDWFSRAYGGKLVMGDVHNSYPEREMCDVHLRESVGDIHKIYIGMEYLSRLDGSKMVKSGCRHKWEITGYAPNAREDNPWENCIYCGIKKEDI